MSAGCLYALRTHVEALYALLLLPDVYFPPERKTRKTGLI
jgi:hypothetical protein